MKPTHNTWEQDPGARWYCTRYKSRDGSHYGDDIWAENFAQAKRHCKDRALGEVIDGYMSSKRQRFPYRTPSEMLCSRPSRWDWQDLIHCATHVTHLALAAGVITAAEALDDQAPLHDLIHLWGLYQRNDKITRKERAALRKELIASFKRIEVQIPGLRPQ